MAIAVSRIEHLHPVYRRISREKPKTDGCPRDGTHHRPSEMTMYFWVVGRRGLLRSRFCFYCRCTQSRRNATGSSNLEQVSSCSFLHFSPLRVGKILHVDRDPGCKKFVFF